MTLRRIFGGVLAALSLVAAAAPADANPLRLRLHWRHAAGESPVEPPPAGGSDTFGIRPTEQRFADVSGVLSGAPDNLYTVTVSGSVDMCPWPIWNEHCQTAADGPRVYARRDLLNYLVARTNGAPEGEGAGTWTISYKSGEGETGSTVEATVTWDVAASFATIHTTIGAQTPALFGAVNLAKLPGDVADKSITTNPGGCFAINQGFLGWAAASGSYSVTSPPAKACASPTLGTDAYTVVVSDATLGQAWTYKLTVKENEWNAAPKPTDSGSSNELGYILKHTYRCGDEIVLEAGNFPASALALTTVSPITNPVSGQTCPTKPFGTGVDPSGFQEDGWYPDDTYDPGWVWIHGRDPLATSFNGGASGGTLRLPATKTDFFLRFSNVRGTFFPSIASTNGGDAVNWLMQDHSELGSASLSWNNQNDRSVAKFLLFNSFDSPYSNTGTLGLQGRDSIVFGNWFRRGYSDTMNATVYNSVAGVQKTLVAFNFGTDKFGHCGNIHPDAQQYQLTGSSQYLLLPAGSTIDMGGWLANVHVRGPGHQFTQADIDSGCGWVGAGVPEQSDLGTSNQGTQLYFMESTSRNGPSADPDNIIYHKMIFAGNLGVDISGHGAEMPPLAPGSLIAHNLIAPDYGPDHAARLGGLAAGYYSNGRWKPGQGTFTPYIVTVASCGGRCPASSSVISRYNAWMAGGGDYASSSITQEHNFPQQVAGAVIPGMDADSPADTFVSNPFLGDGATTLEAVIEAWTPKDDGSLATFKASTGRYIGPLGDPSLIDFKRLRYSAALVTP